MLTYSRLSPLPFFVASLLLSPSVSAYDYKKHIPEEFRHYVPDSATDEEEDDATENQSHEKYGPAHYKKRNFSELTVYGPCSLEIVKIKGDLTVHGPLSAKHTNAKQLTVMGPVDAHHLHVDSEATIYGPFNAYHSTFKQGLKIATTKLSLKDSTLASLTLLHNNSKKEQRQKVYLHSGTTIEGDIVFEDERGRVILYEGAKINGKVVGGKIERRH